MRVSQSVLLLSIEMTLNVVKKHQCHDGVMTYYSHSSQSVNGEMMFAVFQPPQMKQGTRLPALTYLAGLTCTQETFMIKGGAQQFAAEHGIILIAPDTSPRGAGVAGEDDSWDFGTGAGFYIDASKEEWAKLGKLETWKPAAKDTGKKIGKLILVQVFFQQLHHHSFAPSSVPHSLP